MVLFDFGHAQGKKGHFAGAVKKSTLWTVRYSKLIQNALEGRCPDLASSPKQFPMPVR